MKKCCACYQEKPFTDFYFKSRVKGTYYSRCKPCWVLYLKEHYSKRRNYYIEKTRKRKALLGPQVRELLERLKNVPCTDCGNRFGPWVMDFDHLPGTEKSFVLSASVSQSVTLERVMVEVAKCEVVCANCHRTRSYKRLNPE